MRIIRQQDSETHSRAFQSSVLCGVWYMCLHGVVGVCMCLCVCMVCMHMDGCVCDVACVHVWCVCAQSVVLL